jgi:lambda family phage minor tail protein L
MTNIIATDAQQLEINDGKVDLFDLQLISGVERYFHPGVNQGFGEIKFRADSSGDVETYVAMPIELDGMEISADGSINRPTLTMANVGSILKNSLGIRNFNDLVGSTVVARTTFEKHLDNGLGNSSNPPVTMSRVKYKIDRVSAENNIMVSFELAVAYDLEGVQLPRRVQVGKFCSWQYQGHSTHGKGGCIWSATSEVKDYDNNDNVSNKFFYFNVFDEPLCLTSHVTSHSNAYNDGTLYVTKSYVSRDGKYYVAKQNHTSNSTIRPGDVSGEGYWLRVHTFQDYSASTSYSKDSLVRHSILVNGVTVTTIFKSLTNSNTNRTPSLKSAYWVREEACGKLLNSCKCRFQGTIAGYHSYNTLSSTSKLNARVLPFAGFPGTAKF